MDLCVALAGTLVADPALPASAAATARAAAAFVGNGIASPAVRGLLRSTPLGAKPAVVLGGIVLACAAAVGGMSISATLVVPVAPSSHTHTRKDCLI